MRAATTHDGFARLVFAAAACLFLVGAASAGSRCSTNKSGLETCKISKKKFLQQTGDGCRMHVPSNEGFLIREQVVRKGVNTVQCDKPGTCACVQTKSCKTPKGKSTPACGKPMRCSDATGAKRCTAFVSCDRTKLRATAVVRAL